MGGVEDDQWFDKFMDGIGLVFTKVDKSILKSFEFWTELTRDLFDDQPTQDLTGHVSQYPVAQVKGKPSQHWAMRAWKIPKSVIQEQGHINYYDNDGDGDGDGDGDDDIDDDDDDDDDDEEEDTTVVSKSSKNMSELNLGASATSYIPSSFHQLYLEDSDSSSKWIWDYQLLKNVDKSSEKDDESSDDGDDEVGKCHSEVVDEVMDMSWKHIMTSDLSNESLVVLDDEDDVSDKLQGFVDVKQEEIGNNTEFGEVETLFPESDWVYLTTA